LVHLVALQHPDPQRILILGGGAEGLVGEALGHKPTQIQYVELNPVLLSLLRQHLPATLSEPLAAEAVQIEVADPRQFLQAPGTYDLILVGMPEPTSGGTNRFFTLEFFTQCAERLSPEGILGFRLRTAENLWTPQQARRTSSIWRALREVFADVVVLPGTTNIFLAANRQLTRDPEVLAQRLGQRQLITQLVSPPYLTYLYTNDRFAEVAEVLAATTAPRNRDTHPVCYQITLLLWLARFFPVLAWLDLPQLTPAGFFGQPVIWLVLAMFLVGLWLCRRRPGCQAGLLAASAGFMGMVLETAIILAYQVKSGVLYQDLGLLLTMFMAGLAAGAWCLDRWSRRWAGLVPRRVGLLLGLSFGALNLLVARLLVTPAAGTLWVAVSLLWAGGFLVAALFAFASLHRRVEQRLVISPLYAADLLGGCLGSVLASLFLIPVLGLGPAVLAMALVAGLTLLLI
jgi:spermidine synthase